MATHQEKDTLIKKLKEELQSMKDAVSKLPMDNMAVSIIKEKTTYFVVLLKYNDNGDCEIISKKKYNNDPALPLYNAKKCLVMDILQPLKKK